MDDSATSNLQNVEPQLTELQEVDPLKGSLRANVESYLLTTYSWHITPEKIARNFREVLSILDTESSKVAECLSQFDRSYFVELLASRGVFTQGDIQAIASQLEVICQEKILAVHQQQAQQTIFNLKQQIEIYIVHTSKEQLLSDSTLPAFQALLENDAEYETLSQRLQIYDRQEFRHILMQRLIHRQDITGQEVEPILDALEATRDAVLLKFIVIDTTASDQEVESSIKTSDLMESTANSLDRGSFESTQDTTPNTKQVMPTSDWSTWDQVRWKPAATDQQSNSSYLSWSTWAQLAPKPDPESSEETEDDKNNTSDC